MSIVHKLIAASGIDNYWISVIGDLSESAFLDGVAADRNSGIFLCGGSTAGGGLVSALTVKVNPSGQVQWSRTLGTSGEVEIAKRIAADSRGNVIACGIVEISGGPAEETVIYKYDTSGSIQWQKVTTGENGRFMAQGIAVDSSDNIIVCGVVPQQDFSLFKFDSSGDLVWQRALKVTEGNVDRPDSALAVSVDSNDNIVVVGVYEDFVGGSFTDYAFVAKFDSSGNSLWQRRFGESYDRLVSVAIDSNDDIVMVGRRNFNVFDVLVSKISSSGVAQWRRGIGIPGAVSDQGYSVAVDLANNVYVAADGFSDSVTLKRSALLFKYNSSGTLQWQRALSNAAGRGVAVDADNNVIFSTHGSPVTAPSAGNGPLVVAKLPPDGSGLGTYGDYTYEESNCTNSVLSAETLEASFPNVSVSHPAAAGALNDAEIVLSEEKFDIFA